VDGYLDMGRDFLGGHSKSQQFKFSMDSTRWLVVEYNNLCMDKNWLPEHDKGICLWTKTEDMCPMVPDKDLPPLAPHQMKSHEEVKKGLKDFIAH